jgi:hypothetical protein
MMAAWGTWHLMRLLRLASPSDSSEMERDDGTGARPLLDARPLLAADSLQRPEPAVNVCSASCLAAASCKPEAPQIFKCSRWQSAEAGQPFIMKRNCFNVLGDCF